MTTENQAERDADIEWCRKMALHHGFGEARDRMERIADALRAARPTDAHRLDRRKATQQRRNDDAPPPPNYDGPLNRRQGTAPLDRRATTPGGSGWREIGTHDGEEAEPVLIYRAVGLQAVAALCETSNGRQWICTDGAILLNVTHWQPLPAPPIATESGA